jgi:type IV secretory pathway TrbF-like protein
LVGGVGRATEVEEDIDPAVARAALEEPDKLLTAGSALIDDLLRCNEAFAHVVSNVIQVQENSIVQELAASMSR